MIVVPFLALHGILLAATLFVKTSNRVIEDLTDPSPLHSHDEPLILDILAPIDVVSSFITDYDHLRYDGIDGDWHGLKSWLSNYEPPRKMPAATPRAIDGNDDGNKMQRSLSCVVAETVRMSSVDAIMEGLAPKKLRNSGGNGITKRAELTGRPSELTGRPSIPYKVCVQWTAAAHTDKPDKWTQISMALYVSRIRNVDSTALRLALLQNEVKPAKIPALVLDLVLDQKTDRLTMITATIMKWVKHASESSFRDEKDTGAFASMTAAVMNWFKHPGAFKPGDLSKEAQEAIESNPAISMKAENVLEEIEKVLSVDVSSDETNGGTSKPLARENAEGVMTSDERSISDESSNEDGAFIDPGLLKSGGDKIKAEQSPLHEDQLFVDTSQRSQSEAIEPGDSALVMEYQSSELEPEGEAALDATDHQSLPSGTHEARKAAETERVADDAAIPSDVSEESNFRPPESSNEMSEAVESEREDQDDLTSSDEAADLANDVYEQDRLSKQALLHQSDDVDLQLEGSAEIDKPQDDGGMDGSVEEEGIGFSHEPTAPIPARSSDNKKEHLGVLDEETPTPVKPAENVQTQEPGQKRYILVAVACSLCLLNIYLCMTR